MSCRSLVLALVSLTLAACVPPTAGLQPPAGAPDLEVSVTPAEGRPAGAPSGTAGPVEPVAVEDVVPGEYLVGLTPEADAQAIARAVGASFQGEIRFTGRYAHLALPADTSRSEAEARFQELSGVTSVAPNWRVQPAYLTSGQTPDDIRYGDQWAHQVTGALPAWRALGTGFTASNVAIAVLDSGCDVSHPDFMGRVLAGRNYTDEHPDTSLSLADDVTDLHGHGTHVAGIAAASGHNALGVTGVAWDAKILPVKVLGLNGGSAAGILKGLVYAADYSTSEATVRVINLSLSVPGRFTTEAAFEDAMAYAWRKGIAVVVAAGNQGADVPRPGTNPHAIVVAATAVHEIVPKLFVEFLAGFSNKGDRIDVAAPGSKILSTAPRYDNQLSQRSGLLTRAVGDEISPIDPPYAYNDGTSMAAPYVSGVAALMAARYDPYHMRMNATFTDRLAERLASTSDDLGPIGQDPYFGHGRVNVQKALAPSSL